MEEHSQPLAVSRSGPDLVGRVAKLMEVMLVGLGGSLIVTMVFLLAGISATDFLGDAKYLVLFLFAEGSMTLLIILGLLWLNGENLRKLGWKLVGLRRETVIGLGFLPVLFLSAFLVGLHFELFFSDYVTAANPLLDLIRTRSDLILLLVSSVFVGGFKEEIQRAFVLVRFESHLGGIRLGLVLWSMFFAYGHMMQGIDNAVGAGVLGLIFGLLYIWRRTLVAPIVAHAMYDIATLLVYWFFIRS
jgi:membrane protease YdiL (CAAX protease family)